MCRLCDEGKPQDHSDLLRGSPYGSRRNFLKATAATGVAAAGLNLFGARPAAAHDDDDEAPRDSGRRDRRYVIRGGAVMSMDPKVGGFAQLDDGVTTVHDVSQIHHSPAHSDAAIQALFDTGRRAAFGYFESASGVAGNQYPGDASRIKKQWFSSSDQLVHMIMGGEVYLGDATTDQSWTIGRQLDLQIAAHILSPFGIRPIFDKLAAGTGGNGHIGIGPDNLFMHMTGMSDAAWQKVKDVGAPVSIAFPIEMNMRHGMPPILRMQSLGMEPSLSTDVEVTMTADFFTQMRVCMNMQRMVVNQMVLEQGDFYPPNQWPKPAAGVPPLLTTMRCMFMQTRKIGRAHV